MADALQGPTLFRVLRGHACFGRFITRAKTVPTKPVLELSPEAGDAARGAAVGGRSLSGAALVSRAGRLRRRDPRGGLVGR
jgi:hypothetical protein